MVVTVGIYAAKGRLSELIRRAQDGEDIIITDERRGGTPVARLIPYQEEQ